MAEHHRKSFGNTTRIGKLLERVEEGDESAREEVLVEARERLRRLARKMLNQFPRLRERGRAETGMVLDDVLLELYKALKTDQFKSPRDFIKSAAIRIRSTLLDLSRKHKRHPFENAQAIDAGDGLPLVQPEGGPVSAEDMDAFHEAVETKLSEEQKAVFTLLFYDEWSRKEVADILGVSERTVTRRYGEAVDRLAELLQSAG